MKQPLSPPPELNIKAPRRGRRTGFCPCCGNRGGLCESHKEKLAVFREQLEAETFSLTRDGARAKSPGEPQCCTPGCWNPRTPPLAYCHECVEGSE